MTPLGPCDSIHKETFIVVKDFQVGWKYNGIRSSKPLSADLNQQHLLIANIFVSSGNALGFRRKDGAKLDVSKV
jgi:hypothetical protein